MAASYVPTPEREQAHVRPDARAKPTRTRMTAAVDDDLSVEAEGRCPPAETAVIAQLEKLDIHHHYVSPEMVKKLQALGITVDASDPKKADVWDDEVHRYIAVSE